MPHKKKSAKKRLQRVSIRAERRDEVDWDRFAYALLQHVKLLSAQPEKQPRKRKTP